MGRKRKKRLDEPTMESPDVVLWGDERYFAVDFTSGGAPIGLNEREWRAANAGYEPNAGWAVAKRAISAALAAASPGSQVEVGWVRGLGSGLSRGAWGAAVDVLPDPNALSGDWLALVPHDLPDRSAPDAGVAREVELLPWLRRRALPFRVPRVLPALGGVLVREWLPGFPLDLRARQTSVRPWAVVAEVAAAIHDLGAPEILDGFASRREHALAALGSLAALEDPSAEDARSWALEHLPSDVPASLLHGDLLGQNVLIHPNLPPAVIDWEYASRGDPAHDLAIVTRGVRRPFRIDRGMERLIEAYEAAGGHDVCAEHVHIHELSMLAGWVFEERAEGRAEALGRFQGLVRRVVHRPSR